MDTRKACPSVYTHYVMVAFCKVGIGNAEYLAETLIQRDLCSKHSVIDHCCQLHRVDCGFWLLSGIIKHGLVPIVTKGHLSEVKFGKAAMSSRRSRTSLWKYLY